MSTKAPAGRLSEILLKNNAIAPEALIVAEEEAKSTDTTLEKYLVENKLVRGTQMTLALAEYLQMPPITLAHFIPDTDLMEMFKKQGLNRYRMVPVAKVGKSLTVALADPFDIMALDEAQTKTGMQITPLVASEQDVDGALARSVADDAQGLSMDAIMQEQNDDIQVGPQEDVESESLEDLMEGADDAPVKRMVNMILVEALKIKANDIHIEPQEDFVRLRFRVDGILVERPPLPKSMQSAIVSRVKIMSELDIGESRIPQDGRFRIKAIGKEIDVRVSILPTIFGGKVVMRTLDKTALFPNLAALGLEQHAHDAMSYAISQPHGIILVTGPTGSGKTTTLYSCLQELNKPDVNVITCEDPVEYQLDGLCQVRINTQVGLTFASALRAILRQDPDIVLIGEIRDTETAEIAIKAALTGHLVLSTLHANEAAGALTRLLDMGMEPFLLASSVILAQAQRLFRKLCPTCKKPCELDLELLKANHVDPAFFEGARVYKETGCPKCHNIGYRGRGAIMEVLPIDDVVRPALLRRAISADIRDLAAEKGMLTLKNVGLTKVKEGVTSLETAMRVVGGGDG